MSDFKLDKIKEVALLFLKLGFIAFGGPAAHIAMMEDEVVAKRQWMTREHFLDLVGATNLIPGPNSTEMAIHCGFHRAGFLGLIIAGACFIFPAVTLTGILAYAHVKYGHLPAVEPFFYGIRPAVIAVIIGAVLKLGKKALKGWELGVIGAGVMACVLFGLNEFTAILGGGLIGMVWLNLRVSPSKKGNFSLFPLPLTQFSPLAVITASAAGAAFSVSQLFLSFLKIGCILFGSGYVLIAYLEGELVERLGWLTQAQLLDAVAVGQFTPGPVLSTSTFIGYQINGIQGAVAATVGIFLPSFLFVVLLNPLIPKLRQSQWASKFLDAVNISAVGIMAAVVMQLSIAAVTNWKTALIAGLSAAIAIRYSKISAVWLVVGGSLLGYVLQLF
ncbi:MAG: chromate efflux transporter [Candidatus Auribacterota bacterium]